MIVRIVGEGQFKLGSAILDELNELDNQVVEAVGKENEGEMSRLLGKMCDLVLKKGEPVPLDDLVESDLILPSPEISLKEAEEMFTGEGLIPG